MTGLGSENEFSEQDVQGERPHIDPAGFAAVPDRILGIAQELSPKNHEAVGTIIADDGSEHEVTAGSHDFEPARIPGRLWMRVRKGIEGHEKKAVAIGVAGTIVTVAAALAIKKTVKPRKSA